MSQGNFHLLGADCAPWRQVVSRQFHKCVNTGVAGPSPGHCVQRAQEAAAPGR